jgi:mono/diheme cytochrome c family protein
VRAVAGAFLILTLAACSKQEPPPAVAAASVKDVGGSLSPDKTPSSGQKAPPTPEAAASAAPAPPTKIDAALLKQGEAVFNDNCATCHMADGGGVPNMQPSIKGSAWISNPDPQLLLSLTLRGAIVMGEAANAYDNKMPPLDHLSDAEIAAVATYVRQRFGTPPVTEPVTPTQVAIARARPGLPK